MEVTSTLWYLKNLPLYETTKPYVINLPLSQVPTGRRTNQECCAYSGIKVKDIRTAGKTLTLDGNGFSLSASIPLSIRYEEFGDPVKVKDVYCESMRKALLDMTGAEFAEVLHQAVRTVMPTCFDLCVMLIIVAGPASPY
jgi:hypothetical protein